MRHDEATSWLDHPSYAVDALLVFILLVGGLLLIGWTTQPAAPAATFDMQLIPDSAVITLESPAQQDAAALRQELTAAGHSNNL